MKGELPDEAQEVADETFEQLDEKVLLAQILTELQQLRLLLADADSAAAGESDAEAMYECQKCPDGRTVPASDRQRHARAEHNAPPDMVNELFEEVDRDG